MKIVKPFRIFSDPAMSEFEAEWSNDRFMLSRCSYCGKPLFTLGVNDARELIDALQKFVAVSE